MPFSKILFLLDVQQYLQFIPKELWPILERFLESVESWTNDFSRLRTFVKESLMKLSQLRPDEMYMYLKRLVFRKMGKQFVSNNVSLPNSEETQVRVDDKYSDSHSNTIMQVGQVVDSCPLLSQQMKEGYRDHQQNILNNPRSGRGGYQIVRIDSCSRCQFPLQNGRLKEQAFPSTSSIREDGRHTGAQRIQEVEQEKEPKREDELRGLSENVVESEVIKKEMKKSEQEKAYRSLCELKRAAKLLKKDELEKFFGAQDQSKLDMLKLNKDQDECNTLDEGFSVRTQYKNQEINGVYTIPTKVCFYMCCNLGMS